MLKSERVLVLTPVGRDAGLVADVLASAGIESRACRTMDELCDEIGAGAGAAVVSEEGCADSGATRLLETLENQAAWSDLPLVVPTNPRPTTRRSLESLDALAARRNVTFLERPVRIMTLVSTLRSALQGRRRQYEVRDLLARLADAVQRRDEFLAVLAHELRNPLATIDAGLRVIRGGGAGADDDSERTVGAMLDATTALARLVDDLLDVNRISLGKISLRRRRVEVAELVERAVAGVADLIEERDHDLDIVVEPPELALDADPLRVEQVLFNLLSNAAKYTPRGGHVRLEAVDGPHGVRIRVEDDGVGVDRETLDSIFEPFAQIRRQGAARGGLGIGLTLIRQIVELHGGRVEVESAGRDLGSAFTVHLPRAKETRARDGVVAPPRAKTEGLDVLLVEDHAESARLLGKLLERSGHSVRTAGTGAEATSHAKAAPIDVALVDIDLPDVTGYELARDLHSLRPDALLIALTGFSDADASRRIAEAGFAHHLTKPLDLNVLDGILAGRAPGARPARRP